jgi:hypothetical protein
LISTFILLYLSEGTFIIILLNMETKKERRVASAVLPELYEVSDLGRVRRKKVFVDRSRTRTAFD